MYLSTGYLDNVINTQVSRQVSTWSRSYLYCTSGGVLSNNNSQLIRGVWKLSCDWTFILLSVYLTRTQDLYNVTDVGLYIIV